MRITSECKSVDPIHRTLHVCQAAQFCIVSLMLQVFSVMVYIYIYHIRLINIFFFPGKCNSFRTQTAWAKHVANDHKIYSPVCILLSQEQQYLRATLVLLNSLCYPRVRPAPWKKKVLLGLSTLACPCWQAHACGPHLYYVFPCWWVLIPGPGPGDFGVSWGVRVQ